MSATTGRRTQAQGTERIGCRVSKIPLPVIPKRALWGPIEDGAGERRTCFYLKAGFSRGSRSIGRDRLSHICDL